MLYNRQLFYIGGVNPDGTFSSRVDIYDLDSDTWSTGTAMPTARGRLPHELEVINGKVHLTGGAVGSSTRTTAHEVYDLANDTWDTSVADLPAVHSFPLQAHYNGYLWLVTGGRDSGTEGHVQRYDLTNDVWDGPSNFTAHPSNMTDGAGKPVDGKMVVFGGWDASTRSGDSTRLDEIYEFDMGTDTWTQVGTMPTVWTHGIINYDEGLNTFFRTGGDEGPNAGSATNPDGRTEDTLSLDIASGTVTRATTGRHPRMNFGGVLTTEAPAGGIFDNDSVVAFGQVTLSSGSAIVSTGLDDVDATFQLALGVDDPGDDCKVTGRLFWDDSAGEYHVEVVEDGTSVGNPTVNYDIVRVR